MFKNLLIFSMFLILTNCGAPGTALLGPAFTGARTGSIYQTGLSYGSSHVIKITKESVEKVKKTKKIIYQRVDKLHKKNKLNKVVLKSKADIFFKAVNDNLKKYN
tara:strand:+ start:2016 stop:2330 length:315 start_codon:yes stop_codon:yes gene_type:complete